MKNESHNSITFILLRLSFALSHMRWTVNIQNTTTKHSKFERKGDGLADMENDVAFFLSFQAEINHSKEKAPQTMGRQQRANEIVVSAAAAAADEGRKQAAEGKADDGIPAK